MVKKLMKSNQLLESQIVPYKELTANAFCNLKQPVLPALKYDVRHADNA
jgi:hypothetical protein